MSTVNYAAMNLDELRAYMLAHRNDEDAFRAYMDKLDPDNNGIEGSEADFATPEAFADLLERAKVARQQRRDRETASKYDLRGATVGGIIYTAQSGSTISINQTITHQHGTGDKVAGNKVIEEKRTLELSRGA